jgi:hypothetical protein
MKRNTLIKGIAVSVALSAFLTGCGSSGTTTNDNSDNNNNISINGKAVDGYLQYATVCLDLNQDGYCQNSEPNTQTDDNGKFQLNITSQVQEDPNYEKAMLLVYGGKDVDTGYDFVGKLLAPKEGAVVNVTPINTLVAKRLQKALEANPNMDKKELQERLKEAKRKVAQALGLPEDKLGVDPVAELQAGDEVPMEKALQLHKAVEAFAIADDKKSERAEEIYEALAEGLDAMQEGDQGVDKLLDKTLQRAQKNEKVKTLLGGEKGLKLVDAAKKVSENIGKGFEKFDPKEHEHTGFLEKIGAITSADLQKVKVAVEDGDLDNISGQISFDENMFSGNFDWDKQFISSDLALLDIEATDALISKIKALYQDKEKIRPGILFVKKERLGKSDDPELQNVYKKILAYLEKQRKEHEQQHAQGADEVVKITPPLTVYIPEDRGYGSVTFAQNGNLLFQEYELQEDGSFAAEADEDNRPDYIFQNGTWVLEDESQESYSINADGSITLPVWNEKAVLVKGKNIAGTTQTFPRFDTSITFSQDAQMYYIKIEKTDNSYSIDEPVKDYSSDGEKVLTSIPELIQAHCGNSWFMGDENRGIAFAGAQTENGYSCNPEATEGKLVYASKDMYHDKVPFEGAVNQKQPEAGSWEIKTLEGDVKVLVVKPNNPHEFNHDDEGGTEYTIFTVKDGTLYRGEMEPKGDTKVIPAYNKAAYDAITSTIMQNWDDIKDRLPIFDH